MPLCKKCKKNEIHSVWCDFRECKNCCSTEQYLKKGRINNE